MKNNVLDSALNDNLELCDDGIWVDDSLSHSHVDHKKVETIESELNGKSLYHATVI